MKTPGDRSVYLKPALSSLHDMECTVAEVEKSDIFQTFTACQKAEWRERLSRLRDLIHDLEQDTALPP
jgi:hypothetical protein